MYGIPLEKHVQLSLSGCHTSVYDLKMHYITLDPRFPFPDSVGGIFPGPATTQGIEWFSQLAGL